MNLLKTIYTWIVWNIISKIFILIHIKPKHRFKRTKDSDSFPKPPFLVISNHGTFFDPWMAGLYSITPFLLMINDDAFRAGAISRWYLKSVGTIPKKKGASDFKAMKTTLSCLKSKKAVCIFPEGQTTWDGETQLIYRGIEKIAKRAKCPIVFVRFQGNFLSKPWWAETTRTGRVNVGFKVLSTEAIQELSDEQLLDTIKKSIYQNDIKDPENLRIPFTGERLAEGLQHFLWVCKKCLSEDHLIAENNTVTCLSCKSTWEIDAHCRFKSTTETSPVFDLHDWAQFQKHFVLDKINNMSENSFMTKSENVTLEIAQGKEDFQTVAEDGVLNLTGDQLTFSSQEKELNWPVRSTTNFVVQRKSIFQFDDGDRQIRALFSDKSPMKWLNYLRYLNGFQECEKRGYL